MTLLYTSDDYIAKGGCKCPICGSYDINTDDPKINGPSAWANVRCEACHGTWTDRYDLMGYTDLEPA